MRLTCPSCGAEYEVPSDVIPEDGRDVQCSNCGNTWFQRPDAEQSPEALAAADAAPKDAVWHPEVEDAPTVGPNVNPSPGPAEPPAPGPAPKRRELDPAVADILREEAERESRVRAKQAESLEEQPDLGLQEPEDEAAKRARQAQDRMRRLRGEDPAAAYSAAAASAIADRPQSRGDMLPDIDEINQSLRASNERREVRSVQANLDYDDDDDEGSFRRGFVLVFLLFAAGTALYVFAAQLGAAIPQISGGLNGYVEFVDQARLWLDRQVAQLVAMVGGAAEG
ncbi:zinc-ribbon domain-containing protein [Marivita sp. GX14005]|uniref:zinc-ribbon domain-containing protein n=1 Tax=Marivita sp. GX14005 TaxID=2942276 RepID=UPI002018B449|nr:zinc-ribbon domain-containing protein [Marivita sp. GX14005]MCL3881229.1 zinc-ribbon domain-containing protein [Marivita sp. GX14005]